MNFQTMSKQRKYVMVSAAVGIFAMFLPWIKLTILGLELVSNVNGMHGKGIIVFLCFAIAALLSYIGDQSTNMPRTNWFITLICGAVALLFMILFYSEVTGSVLGPKLGFGFYLAAIAALALLLSAYLFKTSGDTIKTGFENLKKDIMSKTK